MAKDDPLQKALKEMCRWRVADPKDFTADDISTLRRYFNLTFDQLRQVGVLASREARALASKAYQLRQIRGLIGVFLEEHAEEVAEEAAAEAAEDAAEEAEFGGD
jgi:hypothetical protein